MEEKKEEKKEEKNEKPRVRGRSQSVDFTQTEATFGISTDSSNSNWTQILKQYDFNNDGFIDYSAFSQMCDQNNIDQNERDQVWNELQQNDKISLQKISKMSSKKDKNTFIRQQGLSPGYQDDDDYISEHSQTKLSKDRGSRHSHEETSDSIPITKRARSAPNLPPFKTDHTKKAYHSDDESGSLIVKKGRSHTGSDILADPTILLMEDPLKLFEAYDMNENGKLTLHQFEQMLIKLYPRCNDDTFLKSIKIAFEAIVPDKQSMDFYYRENVHNLAEKLHPFSPQLPDKDELLNIFISVFGPFDNEEMVKSVYDNLDEKSSDQIEIAKKIHDTFIKKRESKSKGQVQIARMTVSDLWKWIEVNGIPSIGKNQRLKQENENLNNEIATIKTEIATNKELQNELELQKKWVSEIEDTLKSHNDLQQRYSDLIEQFDSLCEDYDTNKDKLSRTQDLLNKIREESKLMSAAYNRYQQENKQLIEANRSLQNQLAVSRKIQQQQIKRYNDNENNTDNISRDLRRQPTKHRGAISISPDSDDNDDDDVDDETMDDNIDNIADDEPYGINTIRFAIDRSVRNVSDSDGLQIHDNDHTLNDDIEWSNRSKTFTFDEKEEKQSSDELVTKLNEIIQEIKENQPRGQHVDTATIETLIKQQTEAINERFNQYVIQQKNIPNDIMMNIMNKLQSMNNTYNQFHTAHQQLIDEINEENGKRDEEWERVVTKLKNDIYRLQNDDKKWREIVDKLTAKTQEAMKSFEEIAQSIKQKENQHKQSLNQIKTAIHEILSSVNNEEFNIKSLEKEKNEEIKLLTQTLSDKERELEKYQNQQDILQYIQENIVHKNDVISLENQLKEKEEKIKELQSQQENQKSFVLSTDELKQILDEKLSNMITKNDQFEQFQNDDDEKIQLKEKKDTIKLLESMDDKLTNIISNNDQLQQIQNELKETDEKKLESMDDKLSNIMIKTDQLQENQKAFISSTDETLSNIMTKNDNDDTLQNQLKQQKDTIKRLESMDDKLTNIISSNEQLQQIQNELNDETKEALQLNIAEIVTQSKEEIIQRIDQIQQQQNLTLSAKQKQLFEDDQKEQQQYDREIKEIIPQQQQYENEKEKDCLLVLLEPEINKLSTKMDHLLLTINNDKNNNSKHLQSEIEKNKQISLILSEIKTLRDKGETETNLMNKIKNDIMNGMKSMLDDQRKCIGLDVSQTMRFLKAQQQKKQKQNQNQNQNEEEKFDPNNNKNNNEPFDRRLDESIKLYIKNVDDSHRDKLKTMWDELQTNIKTQQNDLNSFWSQKMENYQNNTNNNFTNLQKKFDELRLQRMDNNHAEHDDDDDDGKDLEEEYVTKRLLGSPSPTPPTPSQEIWEGLETRIVEMDKSIKSVKPSYLKISGSTFISLIISYLMFLIPISWYIGKYRP